MLELQDLCQPLAVIIQVLLPPVVCSYCHQVCGKVTRGKYSCGLREMTAYKQRSIQCLSRFLASCVMLGWEMEQAQVCVHLLWIEKSFLAMSRYRVQLPMLVLKNPMDKDVPTDDSVLA